MNGKLGTGGGGVRQGAEWPGPQRVIRQKRPNPVGEVHSLKLLEHSASGTIILSAKGIKAKNNVKCVETSGPKTVVFCN